MDSKVTFSELLAQYRKRAGYSQSGLARLLRLNASRLSRIESGQRGRLSRDKVLSLGAILKLPIEDLNRLLLSADYAPVNSESVQNRSLSGQHVHGESPGSLPRHPLALEAASLIDDLLNDPALTDREQTFAENMIRSFIKSMQEGMVARSSWMMDTLDRHSSAEDDESIVVIPTPLEQAQRTLEALNVRSRFTIEGNVLNQRR